MRGLSGDDDESLAEEDKSDISTVLERAKTRIAQRREELKGKPESDEPEGEQRSKKSSEAQLVEIKQILEDSKFKNTRLLEDPLYLDRITTSGQSQEALEESMKNEGLKVPITVVERWEKRGFYVRAGFRRLKAARKLGWKTIPAIVLPCETSTKDQYWYNIIENSTRKSLTTYELAHAAKLMRDDFKISAKEFASRTGVSQAYVSHLLTCIDRLPPYLIDQWRLCANLTFEDWYKLSQLDHFQAIRLFRSWTGRSASDRMREIEKGRVKRKLAPAAFLGRMQKVYVGIEASSLEPRTRDLCLKVVEFCMGQCESIPGIYDPRRQSADQKKAELRRTLDIYQRNPERPASEEDAATKLPPHIDIEEDEND